MPGTLRVQWAKFRVSVVSAVAVLIFLTLAFLMTGGTLFHEQSSIYLYLPDATGLGVSSPVRVDGIDVGTVESVDFTNGADPNRTIKLTLRIENERLASLTPDSYAEVGSDSMIGDKFVDVTSGTEAGHLTARQELRFKPPTDIMKSVDIPTLEAQLRAVDAILSDIEQGRSALGQFVQSDKMYRDVLNRVQQIEGAMRNAVSTTTSLGDALYTDRIYKQVRDPIVALDKQLAIMQSGHGSIGPMLRDTAEYESLMKTVKDLRTTVSGIGAGPFMRSDELYAGWSRTVAGFVQTIDRFNATPLMERTDVYESLNGMARDLASSLNDFRAHPQKYLRLKVF